MADDDVAVKVPARLVARADRLVPELRGTEVDAIGTPTRAAVVRWALSIGLDALEMRKRQQEES